MRIKPLLSLALLVALLGLTFAKSNHHWKEDNQRNDDVRGGGQNSFAMSLNMAFKSAWEAITTKIPSWSCSISSCHNGATLRLHGNGACPTCECVPGCFGDECETCSTGPTTRAPTTSQPSCSILSCRNGGTLRLYEHGCACDCVPGCYGFDCGTCSTESNTTTTTPASRTTTITSSPVTRPNCTAASQSKYCRSGNVVRNGSSCSCQCLSANYFGDYCQLHNGCGTSSCQNSGTRYYDPLDGLCKCACLPCYSGQYCDKYEDPNCYPTTTLPTTPIPMCDIVSCFSGTVIRNGTNCRCACNYGYFGAYCQFYNLCKDSITCKSGGTPYWDPTNGTCLCQCTPGWTGPTCIDLEAS